MGAPPIEGKKGEPPRKLILGSQGRLDARDRALWRASRTLLQNLRTEKT